MDAAGTVGVGAGGGVDATDVRAVLAEHPANTSVTSDAWVITVERTIVYLLAALGMPQYQPGRTHILFLSLFEGATYTMVVAFGAAPGDGVEHRSLTLLAPLQSCSFEP